MSVPNGFKNNSVRFSGSCPKKIEVELDFPNGLYATRMHTDEGSSNNLYYNLPVRIAVQWRFVREGQISSDADDPYNGGWKDFTSIEFTDGSRLEPQTYTLGQMMYDYNSSLGTTGYKDSGWFSLDDSSTYSGNKWLGVGKTFNFGCENVDSSLNSVSNEPVKKFYFHTVSRYSSGQWKSYKMTVQVSETVFKSNVSNFSEGVYEYNLKSTQYVKYKNGHRTSSSKTVNYKEITVNGTKYRCDYGKWTSTPYLAAPSKRNDGITAHAYGVNAFKNGFGVNERSYVASYELTDEECRTLINYDGDNVTTDSVEVRVLRVNPTYFDETQDSMEEWSNMTYQDLCRWKYLRTFSFDKDAFKEALDEAVAAGGNIEDVHASDYPQRPLTKEDMDKFAMIAVSLKQDAAETGGSTLAQLSCIAESFCPNCLDNDENGKTWVPEKINLQYGYYHKYKMKDSSGKLKTKIEEAISDTDIENYKNNIKSHADGYYKSVKGNDFTAQLKEEIFSDCGRYETSYGNTQWLLTDEVRHKYVTNNTASVFALALVGRQLGIDAKTYDNINMEALTEF